MRRDGNDKVAHAVRNWGEIYPGLTTDHLYVFSRMRLVVEGLRIGQAAILKKHGLSRGEFDVLVLLIRNRRAMSPTELSRELNITGGGITKRLRILQDKDLIQKTANATDGRAYLVAASAQVRDILLPVLQDISLSEMELLSALDDTDKEVMESLLYRLTTRVEELFPNVRHTGPIEDE